MTTDEIPAEEPKPYVDYPGYNPLGYIAYIVAEPAAYKKMNPRNGWHFNLLLMLKGIKEARRRFPNKDLRLYAYSDEVN